MELLVLIFRFMWVYLVIALVVVGGYVIMTYNRFASMRTMIEASIQEIGNQLKRQADLIPNLESSAKGYLKHEKGIFKALTEARKSVETAVKSGSASAMEAAENKIQSILPKLQVMVESNPEIKGADVVTKLMNELRDTSDKVMYARRTLIDLTQDFNRMLVTFPSNMVGQMFGMKRQQGIKTAMSGEHLEASETEMKSPKIDLE